MWANNISLGGHVHFDAFGARVTVLQQARDGVIMHRANVLGLFAAVEPNIAKKAIMNMRCLELTHIHEKKICKPNA